MYKTTNGKLKKLWVTLLTLTLSFTLLFATACVENPSNNNSSNDKEETKTETVTDSQSLPNGDFEFYTTEKTSYPYTSSSLKWTRAYSGSLSQAPNSNPSGVIDTSDDAFASLDANEKPLKDGSTTEYFNPRTPYYFGLVKDNYDKEDDDKKSNPQVSGTKVLMINNSKDGGTAQKYTTSGNVTVPFNGYGKLSVWVNTYGLNKNGAYIELAPTAQGEGYKSIFYENVNTNGEWAKVEIYVYSSNVSSTTFKVSLGLGKGNAISTANFVKGFAFFDNVTYESFTASEFEEISKNNDFSDKQVIAIDTPVTKNELTATYKDNGEKADYVDEATSTAKYTKFTKCLDFRTTLQTSSVNVSTASVNFNKEVVSSTQNIETDNVIGVKTVGELKSTYATQFEDVLKTGLTDSASVMYMDFKKPSSASIAPLNKVVTAGEYQMYTFFAKVKVTNRVDASANVTVTDQSSASKTPVDLFTSINVNEVKDGAYGNWTKYTVFIYNPTDEDIDFNFTFTFGLKGENNYVDTADIGRKLPTGYAMFLGLEQTTFADSEQQELIYNNYVSTTQVSKQSLLGKYLAFNEDEEETVNDSYSITVADGQKTEIAYAPTSAVSDFTYKSNNANKTDTIHGLVNSAFVNENGSYGKNNVQITDIDKLQNHVMGDNKNAQAIVVSNATSTSAGYATAFSTLKANSYYYVTANVKVYGNATAYVYLVSNEYDETLGKYSVLSIKGNDNQVKPLQAKVTANTLENFENGNWTEVCFYIATGNKSIDFRVEIWNGARDGSNNTTGTIFIDNVYTNEDASLFNASSNTFNEQQYYVDRFTQLAESNPSYAINTLAYTREPATVKYTDEDGNEKTSTKTFEPTNVLVNNDIITFAYYQTIDVDNVIDKTTDTEEDDATEDTTTNDPYTVNPTAGLQIVSIVLAIVLIIVLIIVAVKSKTSKNAKTQKKTQTYYDRDTREKALKKISESKTNSKITLDDSTEEYDYEAAQNVKEETTEEIKEEIKEEVIEEEIIDETQVEQTVDFNELTKEPEEVTNNPEEPTEDEKKD